MTNFALMCEIIPTQSIMCYDIPLPLLVEERILDITITMTILIAEIMVKTMVEETILSSLSAGTLAVLVLILVSYIL